MRTVGMEELVSNMSLDTGVFIRKKVDFYISKRNEKRYFEQRRDILS